MKEPNLEPYFNAMKHPDIMKPLLEMLSDGRTFADYLAKCAEVYGKKDDKMSWPLTKPKKQG